MISVHEALEIVSKHQYSSTPVEVSLEDSLNYVLAEDVKAKISMPPFNQSAMDGYAVHIHKSNTYQLVGEVKAGDGHSYNLKAGEAVRIFTGAKVPETANAVIMQEKVNRNENEITIETTPSHFENIRPLGEQIHQNEIALTKGTKLNPSSVSYLVSLGISTIKVYPKPKVSVIVTGSELIPMGADYIDGKIYESNSIAIKLSLAKEGIDNVTVFKVQDDYQSTENMLKQAIESSDFVLVSGGISVGEYDFVGRALRNLNTEELFYKVKQKPGKPLFFGKNNNTYVFALPGNPASALTCFYIYALPMLRAFSNDPQLQLKRVQRKISHELQIKGDRAQFLKASCDGHKVTVLGNQSSAMIHGFNNANSLVFIEENTNLIEENTKLTTILL